jgi:hypothetical protein
MEINTFDIIHPNCSMFHIKFDTMEINTFNNVVIPRMEERPELFFHY